jgi:hypothetical protein
MYFTLVKPMGCSMVDHLPNPSSDGIENNATDRKTIRGLYFYRKEI